MNLNIFIVATIIETHIISLTIQLFPENTHPITIPIATKILIMSNTLINKIYPNLNTTWYKRANFSKKITSLVQIQTVSIP